MKFDCFGFFLPGHKVLSSASLPACLHLSLASLFGFSLFPLSLSTSTLLFTHLQPSLSVAIGTSHSPPPASLCWWAAAHGACLFCLATRCCNWHLSGNCGSLNFRKSTGAFTVLLVAGMADFPSRVLAQPSRRSASPVKLLELLCRSRCCPCPSWG